jgi:rod shape determining protein RodA
LKLKLPQESFRIKLPDKDFIYTFFGLIIMGFFALSSAAGGSYLSKQFIFLTLSFGLVFLIYKLFDFKFYQRYSLLIYWLNVALLFILKLFGTTVLGSQRWLKLGPLSIQPSEIAKICLIISLAAWLSKRPVKNYLDILKTLFIIALPAGLVFIQPDLGTTLVYAAIAFGMLFWAGASLIQLLVLISPLVTAICSSVGDKIFEYHQGFLDFSFTVPVLVFFLLLILLTTWYYRAWQDPWPAFGIFVLLSLNILVMLCKSFLWGLLKEYQQKRLTIFLNPESDPLGAGYHILQSLYAIGSGGFWGLGLGSGDLTQGHFVPEQHTDFIFSVIGEELGFIGSFFVILLYSILLFRVIKKAEEQEDSFISLVLIGIFSMLFFHIVVNIGMNLSLMPITGVPLPFLSYGGTSMLVDLFLISLVLKSGEKLK